MSGNCDVGRPREVHRRRPTGQSAASPACWHAYVTGAPTFQVAEARITEALYAGVDFDAMWKTGEERR